MADEHRLFPELPEDISALGDEDLAKLIADHREAIEKIKADDQEFLGELDASAIITQLTEGVAALKALGEVEAEKAQAFENFQAEKEKLLAEVEVKAEDDSEEESGDEEEGGEDSEEEAEGAEAPAAEEETEEVVEEEKVLVTASADAAPIRFSRTPPRASAERTPTVSEPAEAGAALVASSQYAAENPGPLTPDSLAHLMRDVASDLGSVPHDGKAVVRQKVPAWQVDHYPDGRRVERGGGFITWDGPKTKVARQEVEFSSDATLTGADDDLDKIRAVLPDYVTFGGKKGQHGGQALVASGGLCAPLTPIYSMPNFATEAEPVWDSFPVFRAARGGVNVPTPTYIADIGIPGDEDAAISSISEEDDAAGGTFATKSCQPLECPDYTETAVQILAHCREYGNLNARAWPEKIAHENALTMAALSRVSEGFMLDRIKSFFPNVTNGATTLGSLIYVVEAIVEARFGIIGRLRMPVETRFRALLPYWVPDMLVLDTINTPFDRFRSRQDLVNYLRSLGIDPVFYLDSPSTGTTQLPDATQAAAAIDELPADVQWAIYPEGAVLGVDMGVLELGIVRDSTLNSTNDFQVFGERFRNVALIAPAQAGMWVTTTYCANGNFPPAGTSIDCPS